MLVYICVYMLFFFIHMNIYTTIVYTYSTSQLVRVNSNVGSTGLYFDQHFIIFFGLFPISYNTVALPMYLVIINYSKIISII